MSDFVKLPFVSVVIPTLNEEKFLERTLRALKNQDYQGRMEIIVADYKSRDSTRKIARNYADKVLSVKRPGIGAGRNDGAKHARGEILLFIDADSIAMPNVVSELVKVFRRNNVVGATCFLLPESTKNEDIILLLIYNNFIRASLKTKKACMTGSCTACRKESFEEISGYDESLKTLEDFEFAERLRKLGKLVFVDKTFIVSSMRRAVRWGRLNSVRNYLTLYLNHLTGRKIFNKIKYNPVR